MCQPHAVHPAAPCPALPAFLNVSVDDICQQEQDRAIADLTQPGGLLTLEQDEQHEFTWQRRRLQAGLAEQQRQLAAHGEAPRQAAPGLGTAERRAAGEQAAVGRQLLGGGGGGGESTNNPVGVIFQEALELGPTTLHVLPKTRLFRCTGPFISSTCPPGQVPVISSEALHQVHIWVRCAGRGGRGAAHAGQVVC